VAVNFTATDSVLWTHYIFLLISIFQWWSTTNGNGHAVWESLSFGLTKNTLAIIGQYIDTWWSSSYGSKILVLGGALQPCKAFVLGMGNQWRGWKYISTMATPAKSGPKCMGHTTHVTPWWIQSAVCWWLGNSMIVSLVQAHFEFLSSWSRFCHTWDIVELFNSRVFLLRIFWLHLALGKKQFNVD